MDVQAATSRSDTNSIAAEALVLDPEYQSNRGTLNKIDRW